MKQGRATLIEPTETLQDAYMDFLEEFRAAGEESIDGGGLFKEARRKDFVDLVQEAHDRAQGRNLPEGYIPDSTYWLVRGGRVLGTCNLRHGLNEKLRDFGGHVGYSVRPSERNKGFATLMLKLVLTKARALGIDRALITCDKDNIASARVIRNTGGVLDSEGVSPEDGKATHRYWIDM